MTHDRPPGTPDDAIQPAVADLGDPSSTRPLTVGDLREWLARCEAAGIPDNAIPRRRYLGDTQPAPRSTWLYALRVTG